MEDKHLAMWNASWQTAMQAHCAGRTLRDKPEDHHWNWEQNADRWRPLLGYHSFAITCEGDLQGLTRIAFGTFVELWRRNRGWDAVKLAEEAGVSPEEVLEIEHSPQSEPEPSAVYKLAQVFELPAKILLELAGLVAPRTPNLRQAAVRFAARSESVAALNDHERAALEAFVAAITETAAKQL